MTASRALTSRVAGVLALVCSFALLLAAPSTAGADDATWLRVSYDGRIDAADRAGLAELGVADVYYAPVDTYVVYADADTAAAIADLDGVTSVSTITADQKIDDDLRGEQGTVTVQVVRHGEGRLAQAEETHAEFSMSPGAGRMTGAVITIEHSEVAAIAADPSVLHVGLTSLRAQAEDEGTAQILAGNAPVAGYTETLAEFGVDGSGVTIAVVDTGVEEQHPDLDGRVSQRIAYPVARVAGIDVVEPNDAGGHGTHVAGIVAGTGAELPLYGAPTDGAGLRYGQGVAPGAGIIDVPYLGVLSGLPAGGYPQLTADVIRQGAVAWNASWTDGGGAGAGYNANAAIMDALVRDGDFDTDGLQPFSLVFSAGNSGVGDGETSRITSPKEAKNIIAVGGVQSQNVGHPDLMYGSSSRGPTIDGRVAPTVLAPAQGVISARSFAGDSCSTPVLAATPPIHSSCSGTSMASPHVAGAVALITEWWRAGNDGATPTPALVKALLINTADDLPTTAPIPNRDEGWGRVNLGAAFDVDASRIYIDSDDLLTALGETRQISFQAADPSQPVRATLVWTDVPGLPEEETALVNDLDLTLRTPSGQTIVGNCFAQGLTAAGCDADRINNVENVYLEAGEDGTYTLEILAANLPGDGVPGNGLPLDQDFALVLDNAVR